MSSVYWLARSGIAVAGKTPRRVRHGLASTVTSASYLGWRSKRLVTQENMAKVLGLPVADLRVKRAALSSWRNYGRTAASLVCLPYVDTLDVDARTQDLTQGMTWEECIRLAMAPGKGVVITTGHFGSWDLGAAVVARHVPLSAVADTFKDPRLNSLLQGHRLGKSIDIIPASSAARRVTQELAASRVVAIVIDRPVTRGRGAEVTFFDHRTYVPIGSGALSVKSGAAIMPCYFWYAADNRYYIRAFPPILPRVVSGNLERAQEIQRLTQYMFACQEEMVRRCPTQWFMFRRFWPADAQAPGEQATEALAA
jgi:KDO2-lipid IV(A) lauroyltransferase